MFRPVDRHGHTGGRLAARTVSSIVRDTFQTCLQLDPAGYSGQSLRAGFVTTVRSYGVDDHPIARHLRWQRGRTMLYVYDRPTDLLTLTAFQGWW